MANEDWDEALRRIEEARRKGETVLDLGGLRIDTVPEQIMKLTGLAKLNLTGSPISALGPVVNLPALRWLEVGETEITNVSGLENTKWIDVLWLRGTSVSDLAPLREMRSLGALDISFAPVSDISILANLPNLHYLGLTGSGVTDLRPVLDLATNRQSSEPLDIPFQVTPACRDPAIARAAGIDDDAERLDALLAHLRTLPPWPEPLEPPPASAAVGPPPEQDTALPLIWGERGFRFLATQVEADPVVEASLDELRGLLDTLIRKGNAHDDLHARATQARALVDADEVDALRLHIQYQAL